jgi:hypothetical protein
MKGRHKGKRTKKNPPPRVVQILQELPREVKSQQPEQQPSNERENDMAPVHWTAKVGVFLALVVAVIYYLQWRTMIDSVDTARRASERESRALVNIKGNGPLQTIPDKTLEFPVRVMNIGKTSARRVIAGIVVAVVPRTEAPTFGDSASDILPIYRTAIGDLFPGDHSDFNVMRLRAKGDVVKKGGDTEMFLLSKAEYDDLIAGNTYVAVHGRVGYDDVYHVRHWTDFCFWWPFTNLNYHASSCVKRNTTDQEDEP